MRNLGYHIVQVDLDTFDYDGDYTASKNNFNVIATGDPAVNSWIGLAHDIHPETITDLVPYMIAEIQKLGYKTATIGECLGDPAVNWYRDLNGNPAGPGSTTPKYIPTMAFAENTSPDLVCGPDNNGETCNANYHCCSIYGSCGYTDAYCGKDCDPLFSFNGKCGEYPNPYPSISASSSTATGTASGTSSAATSTSTGIVYSPDGTW
jgi:hypothetical protein